LEGKDGRDGKGRRWWALKRLGGGKGGKGHELERNQSLWGPPERIRPTVEFAEQEKQQFNRERDKGCTISEERTAGKELGREGEGEGRRRFQEDCCPTERREDGERMRVD